MDCNICNTPKFGTVEPRTGMNMTQAEIRARTLGIYSVCRDFPSI
jgi:hypothetical protein